MADLLRVYVSLKGPEPTNWDYDRLGAACSATLMKRFGPRWQNVLSAMYAFRRWMRTEYPDRHEADATCWEWIRTLTKVRRAAEGTSEDGGGK